MRDRGKPFVVHHAPVLSLVLVADFEQNERSAPSPQGDAGFALHPLGPEEEDKISPLEGFLAPGEDVGFCRLVLFSRVVAERQAERLKRQEKIRGGGLGRNF